MALWLKLLFSTSLIRPRQQLFHVSVDICEESERGLRHQSPLCDWIKSHQFDKTEIQDANNIVKKVGALTVK